MNVAFLGESTEEKRFLILCLAKIASCHENITVLSKKAYSFDEIGENYEYCGIEFVMIKEGENPLSGISETANYFVDVEEYIEIPDSFKVIVISETTRTKLESCIKLVGEFAWFQPTLNIYIIILILWNTENREQYLSCFWEHGLPSFTEIAALMKYILKKKPHCNDRKSIFKQITHQETVITH